VSAAGPHHRRWEAVFWDRDGTLIEDPGYLSDPEKVRWIPGAREVLAKLKENRVHQFLFTNQSGVGRGWYTLDEARSVTAKMLFLGNFPEDLFTDSCYATESPDEAHHRGGNAYRKPSPRFILEMVAKYHLDPSRCLMVGDKPSDWEAAREAGILSLGFGQKGPFEPDFRVQSWEDSGVWEIFPD